MKKKLISLLVCAAMCATLFAGCDKDVASTSKDTTSTSVASTETSVEPEVEKEPVTILYTNDVHTYVNNSHKDDSDNVILDTSYASVAALKQELVDAGENVLLVDAGDFSQGTAYGGFDEAEGIINVMNEVGYDYVAMGNHEFDYGQFRFFENLERLNAKMLSCNFYKVADNSLVLPAYDIKEIGGYKIAFVGVSTPETITKSSPVYFMDENGNYIYRFYAGDDGKDLYNAVQSALDEVRDKVDYVIGLGHLGVDPSSAPYMSTDVIANTVGFDAFIDGHSHTEMEGDIVEDADGNDVILTQTGCYFGSIGKLVIDENGITTTLVKDFEDRSDAVQTKVDDIVTNVETALGVEIATSDIDFVINDPATGDRLIRRQETNLGNLVADGIYYHFNVVEELNCDIAITNGGGTRADIPAGVWSYNSCKTVNPFGNVICLVEMSGQDVLDLLEHGARVVGQEKDGKPAECGGFIHPAGLTYDIDTTIECTETLDSEGVWQSAPTGEYRVKNVKVYNKETKEYEDLDLAKTYAVGGTNYTLRNMGDGFAMLGDTVLIKDYVGEDYSIFAEYLQSFDKEGGDLAVLKTENSPLASYEGYLLNYEDYTGSGRIKIIVQ